MEKQTSPDAKDRMSVPNMVVAFERRCNGERHAKCEHPLNAQPTVCAKRYFASAHHAAPARLSFSPLSR